MRLFVSLLLVMSVLLAGSARAQVPDILGSRFANATITRNEKPLSIPAMFQDVAGNQIVKGASLAAVIGGAYRMKPYQILDAPEWVYTSHLYDIEAVPPPAALVVSDLTQMLRTLLADRFKLQVELVTRDREIWVLAADRGDPKLIEERNATQLTAAVERDPGGSYVIGRTPGIPGPAAGRVTPGSVSAGADRVIANMNWLANHLERLTGQPVLNLTGLPGIYAFDLPPVFDVDPAVFTGPYYEQLGLVFELRTVPVEQLLVTHVEHPQLDLIDR